MKSIALFFLGALLLTGNTCYSQESFDYSKIAPHPRLLLTAQDESGLRVAVRSNRELKTIHDHILAQCDEMLVKEPVKYEMKGKRLLAVSREALTRIFYLSYAHRMTGKQKYLDRAEEELNTVCDFKDWSPAHFLDAGEMTMAVAIGYDWLYDGLKQPTKEKIAKAIIEHGFDASKKHSRFLGMTNNWNQVCNAGMVYGALALFDQHPDQAKAIIERALISNRPAMDACYDPDGNYPEGPSYWGYGTSFQVMMIAALESALGSDGGMSQHDGFQKTAEYMLFAMGPTGLAYNYSDCAEKIGSNISIFWFAARQNKPDLVFLERERLKNGTFTKRIDESRLLPAVLAFARGIDFERVAPPSRTVWSGHGLTPVVLVRTDWNDPQSDYLGVKGGCAQTAHAHLDAGSFVYDSGGCRWASEFGLQSYITLESKGVDLWNKVQDSQRWDVFRYNNKNHNTLTVNGKNHDVYGNAPLVEVYDTDAERGGKFDLTEVFGGDVLSAVRKAVIRDGSYLEVRDQIATGQTPATVRWTMVTPAKVRIIDGNCFELRQGKQIKLLKISSDHGFELKIWPSENPGTEYDAPNPGTVMIGFESNLPAAKSYSFGVTIKNPEK